MPRLLHHSDVENVFDTPARAAALAGRLRSLDGPDAAVVGTGDTVAPGVCSLVARGRQAIDFYAAAGTCLETFGNHEFDYGPDVLREIVADAGPTFVSANVRDEDGDPFGHAEGVVPYTVRTIDGERVGFVGVTDPATDSLNPHATDLTFDDPVTAVRTAVAEMDDQEAPDHVVVLSHLGGRDEKLARSTPVDAILGGHVHDRQVDVVDGTLLVRPGVNGRAVAEVEFSGSGSGSGPPTARLHERDGADPVSELRTALTDRLERANLSDVVATVTEPIHRDDAVVHGGECRVGNFVADAFRWAVDADVGLSNAGGIRSGDPIVGSVTKAVCIGLVPFEEPVVRAAVTGAELRSILREMAAPDVDFGADDWWHGHVSNARIVWDADAERLREATVGGEPIDRDAAYTIATSEYLLHSDHEFPTLEERHRVDEGGIQYEELYRYAAEHGIDPAVEGRIRIVSEADPARPNS
ncbi:bifunctional metallophosphatase/5'-nucleotidase [Halopenitus malekzadehii]|nr:5'-nucleotidase C-terminal domain-containing protein [Halopenitus malekzadehii]